MIYKNFFIIALILLTGTSLALSMNQTSTSTLFTTISSTSVTSTSTTTTINQSLPVCKVDMNNVNYTDNNTDQIPIALVVKNGQTTVGFTHKTHYFVNFTLNCSNPNNLPINLTDNGKSIYKSNLSTIHQSFSYNESTSNNTYGFNLTAIIHGSKVSIDPFSPPAKINSYLNISLSASANTYQLMIPFNASNYTKYLQDSLRNVEFFYPNGTLVQSWLEGNILNEQQKTGLNTSHKIIYWVNLTPGASGTVNVISMGFNKSFVSLFDGVTVCEAPQLSASYAHFDCGSKMFSIYQNFAGVSLPSGWSGAGQSISNGATIPNTGYLSTTAGIPSGNVVDSLGQMTSAAGFAGVGYAGNKWGGGPANYSSAVWGQLAANSGGCVPSNPNVQDGLVDSTASNWDCPSAAVVISGYEVFTTYWINTNTANNLINYANPKFISAGFAISSSTNFGYSSNSNGNQYIMQWIRQRTPPPNFVMPTVLFNGNITNQPITTTSTTSISTTSTSTIPQSQQLCGSDLEGIFLCGFNVLYGFAIFIEILGAGIAYQRTGKGPFALLGGTLISLLILPLTTNFFTTPSTISYLASAVWAGLFVASLTMKGIFHWIQQHL